MEQQTPKNILIVEDEKDIAEILEYNILRKGYSAKTAYDGETGLAMALSGEYDLILLDVMLPKMDGFELCRRVRQSLDTPIIMLTAREEENDKILGLELGADDYMTKPFALGELFSRIKANIRRYSGELRTLSGPQDAVSDLQHRQTEPSETVSTQNGVIQIDDLCIDCTKYHVTKGTKELSLSKKEYDLLEFLAKNRGQKFKQEDLLENVWGYEGFYGDVRAVDVTISRLRKKIEDNPSDPKFIRNMRGVGYYMP